MNSSSLIIHVVRHGHIPSHDTDVPLTEEGQKAVYLAGQELAARIEDGELLSFFHGPARRARETAWGIYHGLKDSLKASGRAEPQIAPPDSLAGIRNLGFIVQGRTQEAMRIQLDLVRAEYLAEPSPENAGRLAFHQGFWDSDDPIGYWLTHPSPHAEDPNAVAERVTAALRELLRQPPRPPATRRRVICASHSAPMRAFLRQAFGADPGEPDFCESFTVEQRDDRRARVVFRGRSVEVWGTQGNSGELNDAPPSSYEFL